MKKFFAGIAAAAMITVPMTSFALESMSKGALKKATGQAGVSIGLDNIVIYMSSQPTTTYWDNDGTSTGFSLEEEHNSGATSLNGGSFSNIGQIDRAGIQISYDEAAQKLITIGAILDGSVYGASKMAATFGVSAGVTDASTSTMIDVTNGNAVKSTLSADGYINPNNVFVGGISPLTIDVGTCQALSQGLAYNKLSNAYTAIVKPTIAGAVAAGTTSEVTALTNANTNLATLKATLTDADTTNDATAAQITAAEGVVTSAQTALNTKTATVTTDTLTTLGGQNAALPLAYAAMVTNSGEAEAITSGLMQSSANIVGVVIGLPTVEIKTYHTNDIKHIKAVADTADVNADHVANANCEFISIEKSGNSTMAILGGRLEIAPH